MRQVGTFEAKNTLSALIDRVQAGEEIEITRNGKPVARLVAPPSEDEQKARARQAVEWIKANRKENALAGINWKELVEEGRRF